MEDTKMKRILLVTFFCLLGTNAYAANEYLQGSSGHCETATLEPYAEVGEQDSTTDGLYPNSNSNNYNNANKGDNWRVGIRLRIALGSTCNAEYKRIMRTNALLRQQLEMLKMCARYKGLELGPEFGEVKRMCAGVQGAKKSKADEDDDTENLKNALSDAQAIIKRLREKSEASVEE